MKHMQRFVFDLDYILSSAKEQSNQGLHCLPFNLHLLDILW